MLFTEDFHDPDFGHNIRLGTTDLTLHYTETSELATDSVT